MTHRLDRGSPHPSKLSAIPDLVAFLQELVRPHRSGEAAVLMEQIAKTLVATWRRDRARLPYCLDELERCSNIIEKCEPAPDVRHFHLVRALLSINNRELVKADDILKHVERLIEPKLKAPDRIADKSVPTDYALVCCAKGAVARDLRDQAATAVWMKWGVFQASNTSQLHLQNFALLLYSDAMLRFGETELAAALDHRRYDLLAQAPTNATPWLMALDLWGNPLDSLKSEIRYDYLSRTFYLHVGPAQK